MKLHPNSIQKYYRTSCSLTGLSKGRFRYRCDEDMYSLTVLRCQSTADPTPRKCCIPQVA